jgi:hypothetical protein
MEGTSAADRPHLGDLSLEEFIETYDEVRRETKKRFAEYEVAAAAISRMSELLDRDKRELDEKFAPLFIYEQGCSDLGW